MKRINGKKVTKQSLQIMLYPDVLEKLKIIADKKSISQTVEDLIIYYLETRK